MSKSQQGVGKRVWLWMEGLYVHAVWLLFPLPCHGHLVDY